MDVPSDNWAVVSGSLVQNMGDSTIYLTTKTTPAVTDVPYDTDTPGETQIEVVSLKGGATLDLINVTGPVYARAQRGTGRLGVLV